MDSKHLLSTIYATTRAPLSHSLRRLAGRQSEGSVICHGILVIVGKRMTIRGCLTLLITQLTRSSQAALTQYYVSAEWAHTLAILICAYPKILMRIFPALLTLIPSIMREVSTCLVEKESNTFRQLK